MPLNACTHTQMCILNAVKEISQRNGIPGRASIFKLLKEQEQSVSEYRIRAELRLLHAKGFLQSTSGRYGIYLTEAGMELLIRNNPK